MEIKEFTPGRLHDFIYSKEYDEMPVIPISRHRALSHINNPGAAPDDVIMLIAYEGAEMVGYLGIFADYMLHSNTAIKAGWFSCMWVDDKTRGKGVAKKLLERAFERWNGNILVTEFTPSAKGLYDRSGKFNDLEIRTGMRGYLRFNLHELLPKKKHFLKYFVPALKSTDWLLNAFNNLRLSFYRLNRFMSRIESVNSIDELTGRFIESENRHNIFRRGIRELNWIIKFPWLLPMSEPDHNSQRYHFSYGSSRVENLNLVMRNTGGEVVGYMMLLLRDHHLRVPYFYVRPEFMGDAVTMIYKVMLEKKLFILTVFHPGLVEFMRCNKAPFFLQRKVKRHYIISKDLCTKAGLLKNPVLQDGDGDCAFT